MKSFFNKLGLKKFKEKSILLFIISDFLAFRYFYKHFTDKEVMDRIIAIAAKGQSLDGIHMSQIYGILHKTLLLMISLIIFIHVINYIMFFKNKIAAYRYLKFYALTGTVGSLLMSLSLIGVQTPGVIIFAIITLLLLFNALGLMHFPFEKYQELQQLNKEREANLKT